MSHLIHYGIASQPIFWRTAPTCAPSNPCLVTAIFRQPKSISTWRRITFRPYAIPSIIFRPSARRLRGGDDEQAGRDRATRTGTLLTQWSRTKRVTSYLFYVKQNSRNSPFVLPGKRHGKFPAFTIGFSPGDHPSGGVGLLPNAAISPPPRLIFPDVAGGS